MSIILSTIMVIKSFKLAYLSNIIDKKISKQIFGHAFETLANKLTNTINKEENQIIVNNINENKEKLYEKDETSAFYDYAIQPSDWHNNLIEAINVILDFKETVQLDLVWKYKNERIKKWVSDFNWWKQSKIIEYFMSWKKNFFSFVCIKCI